MASVGCKLCWLFGWEPWSSGYERRLVFWRSWVWIPAPNTGWTFFKYICCKNCNVWKDKNRWKRGRAWPIFQKNTMLAVSNIPKEQPNFTNINIFRTWKLSLIVPTYLPATNHKKIKSAWFVKTFRRKRKVNFTFGKNSLHFSMQMVPNQMQISPHWKNHGLMKLLKYIWKK